MEITTYRAEVYRPDSRKPDVAFSDDIETDLSRRDFTVNAMALRLPDPALIDPYGGAVDLAAGRLRTPLAPEISFLDDPLRMLRAARFIARLRPRARRLRWSQAVAELRHRLEIVERGADPRRALEAPRRRRPERGAVVPRRDRASPTSSSPSCAP